MGYTAAAAAVVEIYGEYSKGQSQKKSLQNEAELNDQEAGQAQAAGIQGMIYERRKAAYVASKAKADLAFSGATSTDPSAVIDRGRIEAAGEYEALTKLYEGNQRAAQLRAGAKNLQSDASDAQMGALFGAVGTGLSAAGSWEGKYGTG